MRRVLPLIAVLLMGFAPIPFPKPDRRKSDLESLQGRWKRVSSLMLGVEYGPPGGTTITIKGRHLHFPDPDDVFAITLNAKVIPKQFDYEGVTSKTKHVVFRCIYRLEGNTLTIHHFPFPASEKRPTRFAGSHEPVMIQIFKRQKP
jgi:uncharacterized protein (TIGR03067 family)